MDFLEDVCEFDVGGVSFGIEQGMADIAFILVHVCVEEWLLIFAFEDEHLQWYFRVVIAKFYADANAPITIGILLPEYGQDLHLIYSITIAVKIIFDLHALQFCIILPLLPKLLDIMLNVHDALASHVYLTPSVLR